MSTPDEAPEANPYPTYTVHFGEQTAPRIRQLIDLIGDGADLNDAMLFAIGWAVYTLDARAKGISLALCRGDDVCAWDVRPEFTREGGLAHLTIHGLHASGAELPGVVPPRSASDRPRADRDQPDHDGK